MKPINFWFQLHLLCSRIHNKKFHGDIFSQCIKEHFMFQYSVFYGEYENEKKKGQKDLTFPNGDLNN